MKMRNSKIKNSLLTSALFLVIYLTVSISSAQTTVLSNNTGDGNSSWFVEGEQTLIINGYDLTPLNLAFPIQVNAITIAIEEAVPGASATMVVYSDDNGGSPADAVLQGQAQITIDSNGSVRVPFAQPVILNSPVMWAGFYLPVDTRFFADTSGSSVLTYWGWTPGSTLDLANLGSAQIFGPSDGSASVNLDLGGVARMSVEIQQNASGEAADPNATPETVNANPNTLTANPGQVGVQIVAQSSANLSILQRYPYCGELLFFDPEDIGISGRDTFDLYCRADLGPWSPGQVRNDDQIAPGIASMERRGFLYEIFGGGAYSKPNSSEELVVPVTHCIRPEQIDLNQAVLGIAYGAPRQWDILPSVRYGEVICAEVTHTGFLSYFIPRTGDEATANSNLYFVGIQRVVDQIDPNGTDSIRCGWRYDLDMAIRNEGFEATTAHYCACGGYSRAHGTGGANRRCASGSDCRGRYSGHTPIAIILRRRCTTANCTSSASSWMRPTR